MAKDDKGKIRLIIFDLEGSNETLQEGMRTVMKALQQSTGHRPTPTPPSLPNGGNPIALPSPNNEDAEEADYHEEDEKQSKSTANKPSKNRTHATPKVLELDLTTGDMPFKTYFQQKNPNKSSKRYLVIAAWFKEYGGVSAITIDHIYTCYRLVNLNVVTDIGQVFRSLKAQGWMNSTSVRGEFSINHVGLNQVNDMAGGV